MFFSGLSYKRFSTLARSLLAKIKENVCKSLVSGLCSEKLELWRLVKNLPPVMNNDESVTHSNSHSNFVGFTALSCHCLNCWNLRAEALSILLNFCHQNKSLKNHFLLPFIKTFRFPVLSRLLTKRSHATTFSFFACKYMSQSRRPNV